MRFQFIKTKRQTTEQAKAISLPQLRTARIRKNLRGVDVP